LPRPWAWVALGAQLALACLWVGWAARHRTPSSLLKAEGR
jgi:hypothetical protein